jgi:diacylglycerol kinase family enzyme
MYVYLYDNLLRQKKFASTIKAIETRLTDYGIAGKILRLQRFTNPEAIIKDEIERGSSVIVIVGNDETFGRVLSRAATCDILFGFLPIGPNNSIAQVLGIPEGEESCDVLSRRRKVMLDVGWFNNRYFVSQLHIPLGDIRVEYDDKFAVMSRKGGLELVVCNLQPFTWKQRGGQDYIVHPQDGKLEAFLRPLLKKSITGKPTFEEPSIFPFEEMIVTSKKPFLVEADGKRSKETKITIRLAKKRVHMIVGKGRQF